MVDGRKNAAILTKPTNHSDWRNSVHTVAVVAVTILAPALAGSTTLWAKSVIAIAAGLVFLLWPRGSLLRGFSLIMIAILAIGLIAFLPANFGSAPAWRTDLSRLGVIFPQTRSPQPWLTFESLCLLALGLAWTSYLFGCDWNLQQRQKALSWFCVGVLGLAATMIIASGLHRRVPFWPETGGFGFFPNRNQTGNVFGLCGVMIYALALQGWQRGSHNWWVWLLSLSLIFWALIVNGSRGGVVLFFIGSFAWHIWWIASSDAKRFPISLLFALVLLGGALIWSGPNIVERFVGPNADLLTRNGRISIYRDAWNFFTQSPLFGIGLGNFRALFSSQRQYFISAAEAIHPESDWLWVLVEMGVFAPLLLLFAVAWWLRACFPFNQGTLRATRVAAMIGGCLFVVHGLVDVSGHRIGTLWPALFLASIAIKPGVTLSPPRPFIFQVFGCWSLVMGGLWVGSIFGMAAPTSATRERVFNRTEFENNVGNYSAAISLSEKLLSIAPLDWQAYYERGLAEAALYKPRAQIQRDFEIARYLMPNRPDLALNEGLIWLNAGDEDLAFGVWQESMQRWPDNAPVLYAQTFASVRDSAELRDRWRELGHVDRRCLPILLQNVNHLEFDIELNRLLSEDPELRSLSPSEKKILFATCLREGDQLALADALQRHPEWQSVGWQEMANALANYGDYRPAYETVYRFVQHPLLPKTEPNDSVQTLWARFRTTGNISNDGLGLVRSQIQANDFDEALTTLQAFSKTPNPPAAIYFLESRIWAAKGEWQKAWQAMLKYQSAIYREP